MGNLFQEFTNLNTSYFPNNFQSKYSKNCECDSLIESTSPNKPYEIIKNNQLVGYFWYQGDSIDLIFELSGTITMHSSDNYTTIGEIANSLRFEASFYDFRGVRVLEYRNDLICENQLILTPIVNKENGDIEGTTLTIPISAEISSKLVKGIYKLNLIASHPSGYRETIFSGTQSNKDIIFEVR